MHKLFIGCLTTILWFLANIKTLDGQPDKSAPPSKISLNLSSKQLEFKVGEPFLMSFLITNVSNAQYCERHALETGEPELNGYVLKVLDASGQRSEMIKRPLPHSLSMTRLCLDPGEFRKEIINVGKLVEMTKPGTYRISVEHLNREAGVLVGSNVVVVTLSQ